MQAYFNEIIKPEFSKISFGKETLWDVKMVFSLNGYVPDFAIRQLSILPETGLTSFINRTYGIRFSDFADATLVKNIDKPGMDGNVVILFVALLIGLTAALLSFNFEIKWKIWEGLSLASRHVFFFCNQCTEKTCGTVVLWIFKIFICQLRFMLKLTLSPATRLLSNITPKFHQNDYK